MSEGDKKIFDDCITGKRHAQNRLYNKYAPLLLGLCMRYAKNKEEAEDILQEGFIKIFLKIEGFRSEGSFEGWMKRIMINTALTHNKQNLKHQYQTDITEIEEIHIVDDGRQDEESIVKIPRAKLMSIIQSLPEGYKTVFNLYVIEQYTHKEIAEMLEISVNTSKSQLSKARRLLTTRITQFTGSKKIEITE
jgi:RNA polymerase sigma-70 factor (ECF subfamily)